MLGAPQPAPVTPPAPSASVLPYAPSTFALLFAERHWIMSSKSKRCEPFRYLDEPGTCPAGFQRVYLDAVPTATSLYGSRITLRKEAVGTSASGCIQGLTIEAALYPGQRQDNDDLVQLDPDVLPDGPTDTRPTTSYVLAPDKARCDAEVANWSGAERHEADANARAQASRDAERREVCSRASTAVALHTGDKEGVASLATPAALRAGFQPQVGPRDRLALDGDVAAVRYRGVTLVGTSAEIARAQRFLASTAPCRFAGLRFRMLGDIGYAPGPGRNEATPEQIAGIGRDAGVALRTRESGWAVTCWDCNAFEIVTGLVALGVQTDAEVVK